MTFQQSACSGDSGGPLVCNHQLCGIVNKGQQNDGRICFGPHYFASVPYFADWIRKNAHYD